ncbi:MAG: hypothetical protein PVF04_02930 [Anaerolineae bacterium]
MKRTSSTTSLSDLEKFARQCIAARDHPADHHWFTPFRCPTCGVVPLALTIEHHTGSKKGDFKGLIFGRCSECGSEERIFSFTGKHRKRLREETPACQCGSVFFVVAECERMEGDEGLLGFFDEGVVVGQCSECGRNRVFVHTD